MYSRTRPGARSPSGDPPSPPDRSQRQTAGRPPHGSGPPGPVWTSAPVPLPRRNARVSPAGNGRRSRRTSARPHHSPGGTPLHSSASSAPYRAGPRPQTPRRRARRSPAQFRAGARAAARKASYRRRPTTSRRRRRPCGGRGPSRGAAARGSPRRTCCPRSDLRMLYSVFPGTLDELSIQPHGTRSRRQNPECSADRAPLYDAVLLGALQDQGGVPARDGPSRTARRDLFDTTSVLHRPRSGTGRSLQLGLSIFAEVLHQQAAS